MSVAYTSLLDQIKEKKYKSVYAIVTEEYYFIEEISEVLEKNVLKPSEVSFSKLVLHGKEHSLESLLSQACSFPMMSEKQLIIVREAQNLQGFSSKESLILLENYFLHPTPTTVLVLFFSSIDERKSWVKTLKKNGEIVTFKKLYDNQVAEWILNYCQAKGARIHPQAAAVLASYVGNDLKRISNEISKILPNMSLKDSITPEIIQHYIGISKDFNFFELQKAIGAKQTLTAMKIVYFFSKNTKEHPILPMILLLYQFFTKILLVHTLQTKYEASIAQLLHVNPYFAKDYAQAAQKYSAVACAAIIHHLRQADAQLKGVGRVSVSENELFKELIYKIIQHN